MRATTSALSKRIG
ncbi:hypothetical protein YPPY15_1803, partial [Yersinia pestis PY-15]